MKIPKGMTEIEVTATINKVVNRLGKKYTFAFHDVNDIRQEAWIIAIKALEHYDVTRPLENYLAVCLCNRLKNFKRDNYCRKEEPCEVCSNKDPYCIKCQQRDARNQAKKFLMEPIDISNIRDEYEKNMRLNNNFVDAIEQHELFEIIDKHLSVELREDYLKLKSGVSINKQRREIIYDAIFNIFEDHYK